MGDQPWLPGLCGTGRLCISGGSRQQGGDGVPVPVVSPGFGGSPAHATGPLGGAGRSVPGLAGSASCDRHVVWIRNGSAPFQSGGEGVAIVWCLSGAGVYRDTQLEPVPHWRGRKHLKENKNTTQEQFCINPELL